MRSAVVCIFMLIPLIVSAQTTVTGNQSGVWNSGGSPYLVTGEIVVPSGQTLTIEPGVEVNFQGHYKFQVNGNLQAIGAENDTIFFTTDNPTTGWGGIRIESGNICALSYCRIEYGKTSGDYPDIHGGGLALLTSNAVVSNCVFADNDATGSNNGMGGAVYAINTGSMSGPLTRFIDCRFIGNHAYGEGGAIKFTGDAYTEIQGCEFIENDCNYGGGAISCYSVLGTRISNSLFADNYTMYSNGGALNTLGVGNTLYLINCTVSGNSAVHGDGGGMSLAYATAYFVNTIIYDNPGSYSDDLFLDWGSDAEIHYCDMTVPGGAIGSHNIDTDPLFVDAGNLDFNLTESSPCIDTGTAFFVVGSDTLIDLSPDQYYGSAPDIGVYEFGPATGISDGAPLVHKLHPNYPNPFNPTTTIRFELAADERVSIDVYDISGRRIRCLLDSEPLDAGVRTVLWDGRNDSGRPVASGVYLYRLDAGERMDVRKMNLVR